VRGAASQKGLNISPTIFGGSFALLHMYTGGENAPLRNSSFGSGFALSFFEIFILASLINVTPIKG
jgi:hypothetical protein